MRKYAKIYLLASACLYAFHILRNADRIFMQFVLGSFMKFVDPFLRSAPSVVTFSRFATFELYFPCNLLLILYINNSCFIRTPAWFSVHSSGTNH